MAQDTTLTVAAFLRDHPRATGALFTACLLLMHAGNVMANVGNANNGP